MFYETNSFLSERYNTKHKKLLKLNYATKKKQGNKKQEKKLNIKITFSRTKKKGFPVSFS